MTESDRLYNGRPFPRTHRLTRDVPMTPLEKLGDALERCIVGCQGRRNAERAQAVLDVIKEQGWAVVPREPTAAMRGAGTEARWQSPVRDANNVGEIWQAMIAAAEREQGWTLTPLKEDK